jgi:transposase-like protein
MVISAAHACLGAAIRAVRNGATWQRRMVHDLHNLLALLQRNAQGLAAAAFRIAFFQPTMEAAREHIGKAVKALDRRNPRPDLHDLPRGALASEPIDPSVGAPEQRD